MEHALHLFVLIVAARLFGELFLRVRQPASIGEIVAGVALALFAASPQAVPFLARLPSSPFLEVAAQFGIFFVVLVAGIEMRPREIASQSASSLWVALGGVVLPLATGFALAWAFLPDTPLRFAQALLVGVALSISAVPVAVKVLMELNLLHERVGEMIVAAAIFDDVIGLVLLAVVLSVLETGAPPDAGMLLVLLAKISLFFILTVAAGVLLGPPFYRVVARFRVPAPRFSALIAVSLGFALLAEALGMDFILGPFMAGLFFEPAAVGKEAYTGVKKSLGDVTNGLLGPLFFVSIGARVDLAAVETIPVFLAALLAVAFLGKIVGAGVPARLAGLSPRDAAAVGIGMSGRGAVELVVVSIALEAGLFDQPDELVANLFSALVITAIVTTMAMPIALRLLLRTTPVPKDGDHSGAPPARGTDVPGRGGT